MQLVNEKNQVRLMLQNIYELHGSSLRRQLLRAQAVVFSLEISKGDYLLDIGCNEGFITSYLLKGRFVLGIDISKDSLLSAKKRLKKANVDFVCGDICALPLKPQSFDKITLLEVLEHLTEEKQRKVCKDIDNVLKMMGSLLISVPFKEKIEDGSTYGHLCTFDKEKITGMLTPSYYLIAKYHLPNMPAITLSRVFSALPFRAWLLFNNAFAVIRKGYWMILKYDKRLRYNEG